VAPVLARHLTRRAATRWVVTWLSALVIVTSAGCASRTRVELDATHSTLLGVDGRVIEIADQSLDTTTLPTAPRPTSTTAAPDDDPAGETTEQPEVEVDPLTKEMCRDDKRTLKTAIENYRMDLGTVPTSEFDLIAYAYLRERSELYDVRVDGSVVAQDLTCAAVR
jgi:hypothetical protein